MDKLLGYGRKVHTKFRPWGTPWDPSYDIFYIFVGPNFPNIQCFDVYGGILNHINVFGGI